MQTKHTPGPWEVIAGDDYIIRSAHYPKEFPHHCKSDDTGSYLAYIGNRTADFGEANARLIAAAPELALAARATLLFHSGSLWDDAKQNEWCHIAYALLGCKAQDVKYEATTRVLCDMQRAAIAKAEGNA